MVLIVVDTLRADMILGERAKTPRIDELAADGLLFSQAFSHAPMTLPSHVALFSSRPPFETGVLNNGQIVRENLPLFAEWIAEYGYRNHAVVSLGTLNPKAEHPMVSRGFDTYDDDYWHLDTAPRALKRMRARLDQIDTRAPFFFFAHFADPHNPYNAHGRVTTTAELTLDGEPLATLTTSEMSQFEREVELEQGRHVLEIHTNDTFKVRSLTWKSVRTGVRPRVTWELGELSKKSEAARVAIDVAQAGSYGLKLWISDAVPRPEISPRYAGEVEFVDRYVGELLDELRARGLYDDSLIVFTSDHGESIGERKNIGHSQNLYDEMLHVPLIVKPPTGHPAGEHLARETGRLVPHMDVVPTLLEMMALPPLPGQKGSSLLGQRQTLLYAETHRTEAKRTTLCIRDERYKLIYGPREEGDLEETFELYDLEADPGERENVFTPELAPPLWIERLRTFATRAEDTLSGADPSEAALEQMRALGYL